LVQLKLRLSAPERDALQTRARQRRVSVSQLLRLLIARELEASVAEGSLPDESAVREMAILIAVELVLKLQETTIPGGITRSRQLLESAARAAINRIETVEASLIRQAKR
jgi:post-segregation antitoxin (ccd killing protein)